MDAMLLVSSATVALLTKGPLAGEENEQIIARIRATLDSETMPDLNRFDLDNMLLSERMKSMGKSTSGGES